MLHALCRSALINFFLMKREMTITYATDSNFIYSADRQKPMIRLANFFLLKSGFRVGDKIKVEYLENKIIINKAS